MATSPLPDAPGVLAGSAHDLPRTDGDAVLTRLDRDPLVPLGHLERYADRYPTSASRRSRLAAGQSFFVS